MSLTTEIAEVRKSFWQQCQTFFQNETDCFEKIFVDRFEDLHHIFFSYLVPSQTITKQLRNQIAIFPKIAERLLADLKEENESRLICFQKLFNETDCRSQTGVLARRERAWEAQLLTQLCRRVENITQASKFLRSNVESLREQEKIPHEIYWIAREIFKGRWKYEAENSALSRSLSKNASIFYQYSFDSWIWKVECLYRKSLPFLLPPRNETGRYYRGVKSVAEVAEQLLGEFLLEKAARDLFFEEAFEKCKRQMITFLKEDRAWEGKLFIRLMQRTSNILYALNFLQNSTEPVVLDDAVFYYRKQLPVEVQKIACELLNGVRPKYKKTPIAAGAYGKLIRCWMSDKTIPICCKVFYREKEDSIEDLPEKNSEETLYCMQETQVYKILDCHPNIPSYYASFRNLLFLEYVEGDTLENMAKQKKTEGYYRKIPDILRQICSALRYLHEEFKILHRDLKANNVIVRKDGRVKVIDFGLIGPIGTHSTLGMAKIAAPEVDKGEEQTPKSDIWSLGVCLLHLLTGGKEFGVGFSNALDMEKKMMAVGLAKVKIDQRIPLQIPDREKMIHLIESMLTFDPKKRPSIAEILSHPYLQETTLHKSSSTSSLSSSAATSS